MKLGVCIPYRDRELHLNEFVPKVGKYLKNKDIDILFISTTHNLLSKITELALKKKYPCIL